MEMKMKAGMIDLVLTADLPVAPDQMTLSLVVRSREELDEVVRQFGGIGAFLRPTSQPLLMLDGDGVIVYVHLKGKDFEPRPPVAVHPAIAELYERYGESLLKKEAV